MYVIARLEDGALTSSFSLCSRARVSRSCMTLHVYPSVSLAYIPRWWKRGITHHDAASSTHSRGRVLLRRRYPCREATYATVNSSYTKALYMTYAEFALWNGRCKALSKDIKLRIGQGRYYSRPLLASGSWKVILRKRVTRGLSRLLDLGREEAFEYALCLPSCCVFEVHPYVHAARSTECRVKSLDVISGGKQ